jgi:hypothetical protein
LIFLLPCFFIAALSIQPYFKYFSTPLHPARLLSSVCRIYTCLWFRPSSQAVKTNPVIIYQAPVWSEWYIWRIYFNSLAWNIIEAPDWYVLAEHLAGWFGLKTGTNYDTLWVMILCWFRHSGLPFVQ